MNMFGIEVPVKNLPVLDQTFMPLSAFVRAFDKSAANGKEIAIAVERNGGCVAVRRCRIHGTPEMQAADRVYVERTVKMLLWATGGFHVMICGDDDMGAYIAETYCKGGAREFDVDFMSGVYEQPFVVESLPLEACPAEKSNPKAVGRHLEGCRIGFDAGGSDRKVSAVIDG
ncbi:MAG: ROK family protein, partial [Clostridia bacterium]|nr:ROK family protein [Clostridia bacterium]